MPPFPIPRLPKPFNKMLEHEMFRRVLRNSSYLFSASGIAAALSMVQGVFAARLLGVEMFGVMGAIIMLVSVINKLASFRMGELVIKYVSAYEECGEPQNASAVFKGAAMVEIATSIAAYGLVWLLAAPGAQIFLKDISLANQITFYGLIILFNLVTESSTGLLQISNRYRKLAGWNIAQSITTLAFILGAFFLHGSLVHILLAYMAGKAVSALGLVIHAFSEASRRWGKNWWESSIMTLRPRFKELAHFAISTNLSATISLATKDSEILWVSWLRSPVEAGYYKLALSLANMLQMPTSPLPQTTYPELAREVQRKNWPNVRYILRQGSMVAGAYSLVATALLVILGKPLISLLYKPEYLPAYPALIILLVGFIAADTFYWRRVALLSFGRADFPVKVNAILASLKVLGTLVLTPRFGFLASAALLAGFYWAISLISFFKVRQLIRESEQAA